MLLVAAVVGFGVPSVSLFAPDIAYAQEERKPKSLLELLFGRNLLKKRNKQNANTAAPAKRVTVKQSPSRSTQRSSNTVSAKNRAAAAKVAAAQEVEKNEDAAKILVVGDFMASHLADGLTSMFAENPSLRVVDRSVALSGLVRDDVHDWPATVAAMISEVKPIAVVALVGMNDRQLIRTGGKRLDKLSSDWQSEYDRRADGLAANVREQGVPMIWVGLLPVSRTSMNNDYLKFNEVYRSTVERYGGSFVDVWDGFVDDEGRYVRSGPDINGQIVSLRRSDGINLTASGKIKLGFYVEKAIKKLTGFGKDALVSSLSGVGDYQLPGQSEYDPATTGQTVVIALAGASADGGNALEGDADFLNDASARDSLSFELVSRGMSAQPHPGRVDSNWGRPSFDVGRTETPEPVLANMRGMNFRALGDLPPLPAATGDTAIQ